VHNSKRRLEQALENIEKDETISEKNKKAIYDFHNYAIAQGLTLSRVLRYLYDIRNLAHYLKKDFDQTFEIKNYNIPIKSNKTILPFRK